MSGCEEFNFEVSDPTEPIALIVINEGVTGPAGPAGGSAVDSGTRADPILIDDVITTTADATNRIFIAGDGGPVTATAIVVTAGCETVILFGTSDTDTVSIPKGTGIFELRGEWVARSGSVLVLDRDGGSLLTERCRNEI